MTIRASPEVKEILRACAAVACEKVEAAGLVPLVMWQWLDQGSVYVELFAPLRTQGHRVRPIGITIRMSDHQPGPQHDASWSIHPGSVNDIDRLIARARREFQKSRNEARSRSRAMRQHCDLLQRKSYKRGR